MAIRSLLLGALAALSGRPAAATSYSELSFEQLAARAGYAASRHRAITGDGYILTMFRLAAPACDAAAAAPVLLMHGLLENSDTWLDAGNASLPYLLADDCVDLWVGNTRGSYHGRQHERLDPDRDAAFWNFSLYELGYYDVPAQVDLVLRLTGRPSLTYVGYSQGGGAGLIMCSERLEYNDKIDVFVAIAPAVRFKYVKSPVATTLSAPIKLYLNSLPPIGNAQEVFAKGSLLQKSLEEVCAYADDSAQVFEFCQDARLTLDSEHAGSVPPATEARLFAHLPVGASVRLLQHYMQLVQADNFNYYDNGPSGNLIAYGTPSVPKFCLDLVTVPIAIFYGPNDYLISPKDVLWLKDQLPNVIECTAISDPLWNHLDETYSQHIPTKLYPVVKKYLLVI